MMGLVNAGGAQTPFFILSVDSYPDTFAGMLAWEPRMQHDLAPLFPLNASATFLAPESETATATTTATSTPTPQASPFTGTFRDEVVSNHDVRVYRDIGEQSVLLYGYWDKKTLVIARDPAAFTEILRRLATSNMQ
jgi:hypothetical protein